MSRVKIGVLVSGNGSNLQTLIDNIHSKDGDIVVVISNKVNAYGLERARMNNIDSKYVSSKDFENNKEYNNEIIDILKNYQVDLVVLAGYMKILSKELVNAYSNRIINIHPSLIPSFCGKGFYGLKVHQAVLEYGVKLTGVTVHIVDEDADTGPIIMQRAVEVLNNDTAETLQKRVLQVEHQLLPEAVKLFCQGKIKVAGRKVTVN